MEENTPDGMEAVSRQIVHRRAIAEVYLTTSTLVGEAEFRIEAQWPRRHYMFDVGAGRADLVLIAETLRQATILTAHRYFGVPRDHVFLMGRLETHLLDQFTLPITDPADVIVTVEVDDVRRGSRGITALRTRLQFTNAGEIFSEGLGELQVLHPGIYNRLRPIAAVSSTASVPTDDATKVRGVSLRLATTGSPRWELIIDHSHPVFFDHPLDHVPGMLVVEAVRQLLVDQAAGSEMRLTSFDGHFTAFLDLDAAVYFADVRVIRRPTTGGVDVTLRVEQHGDVAAVVSASSGL